MNQANRNRILWLLVVLVSVHMIVTTAIFLATATIPNALMTFTLIVFGVCGLAAVYFMGVSPRGRLERVERRERIVVQDAQAAGDVEPVVRVEVDEAAARRGAQGDARASDGA